MLWSKGDGKRAESVLRELGNGTAPCTPLGSYLFHLIRSEVDTGSATNTEDFAYLVKYSPVQNVKPGVCYPATLITTADDDDRVVPSHSFKFAAALQAAQGCDRPVLIRIETQGSHGYRPTDKRIAELADEWAFAAAGLGMKP